VRFSVKIVHFTLQKYNHVWYYFAGCVWPREVSVAERKLWKIFVRDNFSGKIDFLMSFSFKMVHFTLSCFIGIVKSVWLRGIRIVECRLYKIIFQDNFPGKTDFFLVFYLKWSIILWKNTIFSIKTHKKISFAWKFISENWFSQFSSCYSYSSQSYASNDTKHGCIHTE
jgi:hypothetical protein